MSLNSYKVSITLIIEADSPIDAKRKYWERIDDPDYAIEPKVKRITSIADSHKED